MRASAEHGGRLAYEVLQRERLLGLVDDERDAAATVDGQDPEDGLWAGLQMAFALPPLDRDIDGRSAELLFALSTLRAALPPQLSSVVFAATGQLNGSGVVQAVDGVAAKVWAALDTLPQGGRVLYPKANEADVGLDLQREAAAKDIKLIPVQRLEDAARALKLPISGGLEEPWRGLQPYEAEHRAIFVGRRREEEAIHRRLLQREASGHPGALVLAASGTGKTSFLQAGVLPELQFKLQDGRALQWWRWRPGSALGTDEAAIVASVAATWNPAMPLSEAVTTFQEFIAQLKRQDWGDLRLVWLVDPFEEIFISGFNTEAVQALCRFIKELQQLGLWVLGGMPSRYLENLQAQPDLLEVFGSSVETRPSGFFYLDPLSPTTLRLVIEKPARLAGLRLEERDDGRLADFIYDDLEGQDEVLPLLSVALARLHERAGLEGRTELRIADYQAMGGLTGAIQAHATEVLHAPELSEAARREFPRLVRALTGVTGQERELVPRNLALDVAWEVGTNGRELVDWFVKRRLLAQDDGDYRRGEPDQVRVVHRALLAHWLREAERNPSGSIGLRELLALRDRLLERAMSWDLDHSRSADALLRSAKDIADARTLQEAFQGDISQQPGGVLFAYIEESIRRAEALERSSRRKTKLLLFLALVSTCAALLAGYNWRESVARLKETLLQSLAMKSRAITEGRSAGTEADAVRLALAVIAEGEKDRGLEVLLPAVNGKAAWRFAKLIEPPEAAGFFAFSPTGKQAILGTQRGSLLEVDLSNGSLFKVHGETADNDAWKVTARISLIPKTSKYIFQTISLTGARSKLNTYDYSTKRVEQLQLSTEFGVATHLVVTGENGYLFLITGGQLVRQDLSSSKISSEVIEVNDRVTCMILDPTGKTLFVGSSAGMLYVIDVNSGNVVRSTATKHRMGIGGIAVTSDGQTLATGGHGGEVATWDAVTLKVKNTIEKAHSAEVLVYFSPDGSLVGTSGADKTLRFWHTQSLLPASPPLTGSPDIIAQGEFTADGSKLVTVGRDSGIRVWELADVLTRDAYPRRERDPPSGLAYRPDGKVVATGGSGGEIHLYSVDSRQHILARRGHYAPVSAITFSHDGTWLVSGSMDGSIVVWSASSLTPLMALEPKQSSAILDIGIDRSGTRLVALTIEGKVDVWDLASRKKLAELGDIQDKSQIITSIYLAPTGEYLVTGNKSGQVRQWSAASGVALGPPAERHRGAVLRLTADSTGERIVSISDDGGLCSGFIGRSSLEGCGSFPFLGYLTHVSVDPTLNFLGFVDASGTYQILETKSGLPAALPQRFGDARTLSLAIAPSGGEIAVLTDGKGVSLSTISMLKLQPGEWVPNAALTPLAISPGGDTAVTGLATGFIQLWHLSSGRIKRTPWQAHLGSVSALDFTADGTEIVSGGQDGYLRFWSADTGTPTREQIAVAPVALTCLRFVPLRGIFVICRGDGQIEFRSPDTMSIIGAPINAHSSPILAIGYTQDGDKLVTGDASGILKLWDVESHSQIGAEWKGHEGGIASLAFLPDGKRIVSTGAGGQARIWESDKRTHQRLSDANSLGDLQTLSAVDRQTGFIATAGTRATVRVQSVDGRVKFVFGLPIDEQVAITNIAYSNDGRWLVVSDQLGNLHPLPMAPLWSAKVCDKLTKNWTREEWQRFVGSTFQYRELCPGLPVQ